MHARDAVTWARLAEELNSANAVVDALRLVKLKRTHKWERVRYLLNHHNTLYPPPAGPMMEMWEQAKAEDAKYLAKQAAQYE
jgi:hypothetical protein